MKSSKSLLILIPLLIGGIEAANSEVIVPALSEFTNVDASNLVEYGENGTDKTTQDLNCSAGNYYPNSAQKGNLLVWACIDALSDSVGSSSTSSTTDSAASTNTSNISTNTSNISTNTSNIKNLGEGVAGSTALTAALTALPQTSKESKFSCGVGTGAYSSRYAVGFGCASKLNERVDVNAGGSYVFGGSKSYGGGTLDSGVLKAGFVFKLGELNKSTHLSLNESKELKKEVNDLKAKNDEIISHNQKLLARLEKLENIALKFQSNSDVISMSK